MLESLKPTQETRIMDLVEQAGIDVSDWANFKNGHNPRRAASNPKYCYEWVFVDETKVIALNLWHEDMEESGGIITHRLNFRARAQNSIKEIWRSRDTRRDKAIQLAIQNKLPIRVIVVEGRKREFGDDKASSINCRLLDPLAWAVTAYNAVTGDCVLTRGAKYLRMVDQFALAARETCKAPEKKDVSGSVFMRDGRIRAQALDRSNGNCEWCGAPGFAMANGELYLETHHILPLSQGGADSLENVVALCANHHREAHHGLDRAVMGETLKQRQRH